jgi:hypothetical protein
LRTFDPPEPGDIVWCRFPHSGLPGPGPKPRPALVLQVGSANDEPYVHIAYGTSQKTGSLHAGEFLIAPQDAAAYAVSGLAYPTKFDLGRTLELPYNDTWFGVPPRAPFGQTPKLGVLHPSLMRRAKAAFEAAK